MTFHLRDITTEKKEFEAFAKNVIRNALPMTSKSRPWNAGHLTFINAMIVVKYFINHALSAFALIVFQKTSKGGMNEFFPSFIFGVTIERAFMVFNLRTF